MLQEDIFDVIVVGGGISGINAGYRIQESLPDYSYAILEARHEIGGTWSLFKYPGIRSDSDLYTFGFAFDPWTEDREIASAESILNYLRTVAARHGIDKHVKLNHSVTAFDWKSEEQKWKLVVTVGDGESAKTKTFWANFVVMGTGYYDYNQGLESSIPGIESFQGPVVHPQFWPKKLDYADKKVVIVGSGATAVTILPALAETGAGHVTMLQRSPGYFVSLPASDPLNGWLKRWLPLALAHFVIRWRFLIQSYGFFYFCQLFPQKSIQMLRESTEKELPPGIPVDPHFIPNYKPWQQRMCITPDGDFFRALRSGKAGIETGHIDSVTATGIKLKSGQFLPADIIVTATGLKVALCGKARLSVDGRPIAVGDQFVWRGILLEGVPNLAFVFGYTNASWTLGSDATARAFVRLLKKMRDKGQTSVVATVGDSDSVKPVEMLNLNSSYIKAAVERKQFPKTGDVAPWKPRRTYFVDTWFASFGDFTTGLVFKGASA